MHMYLCILQEKKSDHLLYALQEILVLRLSLSTANLKLIMVYVMLQVLS